MESLLEKTTKWTSYKNLKIIKFKTYFYSNALFFLKKLIFALVKLKLCLDHLFFYLYHYY